ncbi:MAG: ATP-binding protein [Leadbetterella sp.]
MKAFLTVLLCLAVSILFSQTKESVNAKIDKTLRFYESKKDSIKINAEQIRAESKKLGLKQEALYYHRFMGFYYEFDGKIDLALNYYLTFLSEAEKNNFIPEKYQALGDLMNIYFNQNQLHKCKEILKKAIKEGKIDNPKPIQMAAFYNNLGMIYGKEKKADSALLYYQKSLEIKQTLNDPQALADLKTNMASLFLEKGDINKALVFTNESLTYHEKNKMTEDLWFDYENLAHIWTKKLSIDKALNFANRSLAIAIKLNSKTKMKDSYETLAETYQVANNHKASLEYTQKMIQVNDEIVTQSTSDKLAELQEKYESEKKERLNQELSIKLEGEKRTKTYYLVGFLGLVLLTGGVLFAYYKNQQKNKIIATRNQELTQINREKNRLISMVSHDLKTPFLSIRAWNSNLANILKDKEKNLQESMLNIGKSADQGLKLIARILDVEKESLVSSTLELKDFDLIALVKEVCLDFAQVALQKSIEIEKDFQAEQAFINSDPEMLQRVFENLISNAIKYSNPNSKIEIRVQKVKNEHQIVFKDHGIGIQENELHTIFQEYGTTSSFPTEGESSTGLGLSITKRILDELGGKISVNSQIGMGSEFVVSI